MKNHVIQTIEQQKIIAILRGIPKEKLIPLAEALYSGGIRHLEVTFHADGKITDAEIAEHIAVLASHFMERMYIGAGTVLTVRQVELTKKAGGRFIISPNTDAGVISASIANDLVSIPGAFTATEIVNAQKLGADFVKLFPAVSIGTDYIKAIKAPLSNVRLLAVGGIHEHNMAEFLKAGVCGFGIGSDITNKKDIEENNWDEITRRAKKYAEVIKNV